MRCPTPSSIAVRPRLLWAGAIALFAIAVAALAQARGLASRKPFEAPAAFGASRWALVADAAEAVRVWTASGLTGRKLVVLTGRWAPLQTGSFGVPASPSEAADFLTPESAIFAAMRAGIAREMAVAMPQRAYEQRLQEIREARGKGVVVGEGWFRHSFHGFERRFCVVSELPVQEEPALVLVEPSFFDAGAPARADELLRGHRVPMDLGLIAASDPQASQEQRSRAADFAAAVGAVKVEVGP